MRNVTEVDLRAPEFREGSPEDYEFRADGEIVRKDRWEKGIRDIVSALGMSRDKFEINDIVRLVKALAEPNPGVLAAVDACKAMYGDFSAEEVNQESRSIRDAWCAGKVLREAP